MTPPPPPPLPQLQHDTITPVSNTARHRGLAGTTTVIPNSPDANVEVAATKKARKMKMKREHEGLGTSDECDGDSVDSSQTDGSHRMVCPEIDMT